MSDYDARADGAASYELALSVMRRAIEIERTGICRDEAIRQAMAEDESNWRSIGSLAKDVVGKIKRGDE